MRQVKTGHNQPGAGARHPLLLQQRFNEIIFWPSIFLITVCFALLLWAPPELESKKGLLSVILAGVAAILVLTSLYRLTAYVQCRVDGLRLKVPFYHLTIPYDEIRATRPTDLTRMFSPTRLPTLQHHFLAPVMVQTAVVVDMDHLPRSRAWLRIWLSRYMICPDSVGLVLPVRDWILFRTEIDEFRSFYRSPHH